MAAKKMQIFEPIFLPSIFCPSASWPTHQLPEVFGSQAGVLQALVRQYLFVLHVQTCAEPLFSENPSRDAAMPRAEKWTDALLEHLNSKFHRLRQSSIDEERSDVVSGFAALPSDR